MEIDVQMIVLPTWSGYFQLLHRTQILSQIAEKKRREDKRSTQSNTTLNYLTQACYQWPLESMYDKFLQADDEKKNIAYNCDVITTLKG